MKVAIVGASGHLGGKTLDAALALGHSPADVVAVVRTPSKLDNYATRGVQVRRGDYGDPASLKAAFDGVDRLLLVPSFAGSAERVVQYDNAITAARDAGVGHILHYGLVATSLKSSFPITAFLLYAESALKNCGLGWTVFRNSLYADPIRDWLPSIARMGSIPYPTGNGRCGYVSRDDAARAAASALCSDGHDGKVYNLTGPAAVTTEELCEIASRATGKDVRYTPATDDDYVKVCVEENEPEGMIRLLLPLYHDIRDGLFDVASSDIEDLTGVPPANLEDYFRSSTT